MQETSAPPSKAPPRLPLAGLTVLDLTRVRAGPTAVRQLADWGADVVKIEMPDAEALGGPREGPDFQNLHRNKRSLTLNLKAPEGLAAFRRMVAKADVVVENYRPDVKDRLGVGYETLRAINPRLVYASISGFGQSGPYRDRPGFDQIAQGMGGLMSITGLPGQGPVRVGIPVADLCAGLFAAQGILLALLERERSGEGQAVETSLLQAQIFMLDFQAARWLMKQEVAGQAGNNHPTSIPTGVFRTRDGFINIATTGERIWQRMCQALGAEHLLDDPRYRDGAARSENRDALSRDIDAALSGEDSATWIERLNAEGVPSGAINAIDAVFADPQVQHLGVTAQVHSPHLGPLTMLAQPVRLSRTPSAVTRHPPGPGEHSDEILSAFGFAPDEVARLRRDGVV
ncbi:Acetyl-CoA:oxalate CoA-transferase [Methylobacterium crusticola]|uniref:Acetyl-CoA:oxalate CoA-transferase n=1 Tax=Methylobacterium crusticola TaxID=1697972 RepID=A0ABQ4RAE8_9HYPH|nr:CoA transferase [Methylobacterium crusticola]GJD53677.1 Acetyl-CoA:oxalate CoA-transferase [Methylobacterium crusticola]